MSAGVPDEIIRGNGEIAASLPHLLGYRPGDQTVVVVGLVGNRLGPIAVARPPANGEGFNPATCDGFAREVCPALERHGVTTFLTVGYGPTGAEHAHLLDTVEVRQLGHVHREGVLVHRAEEAGEAAAE